MSALPWLLSPCPWDAADSAPPDSPAWPWLPAAEPPAGWPWEPLAELLDELLEELPDELLAGLLEGLLDGLPLGGGGG